MTLETAPSYRIKLAGRIALVLLPVVLSYAVLFHYCVNIPVLDDYDAGLAYLNHSVQVPTLSGKLLYLLAAQQNEYKIVFGHAVVWMQYAVFGSVDFRLTCVLGDLFTVLIGWLLWKMFLPREKDTVRRLALFFPVSLLWFQLNYTETLNWGLPTLQNVNVVFFSLAAIYLLVKPSRGSFWGAIAMLVLAISASGNGFLVVPVGLLLFAINRQYARAAVWLGATAACMAGYAYHYNSMSSQSPVHHSILATILHMNPFFVFVFMGAELDHPLILSSALGLGLTLYFLYMGKRGYWRKNPLAGYCILFLAFTAIGVAGIRSELGLVTGTASRYRIYSDLLLIFAWSSFVDEFLNRRRVALRRSRPYLTAVAVTILLFIAGDAWGIRFLRQRNHSLILGMEYYEHPLPSQPSGPALEPADGPMWDAFAARAKRVMDQSIQLGIYHPPIVGEPPPQPSAK